MKRPHLSPRTIRGAVWAGLAFCLVGAALSVDRTLFPARGYQGPDADTVGLLESAATAAVPDSHMGRVPQPDGPGRWQMSLIDGDGRCWKIAVNVAGGAAAVDGDPAPVGCWAAPHTVGHVGGDTDLAADKDTAVREFLDAYLTGGDVSRFKKPGVKFAQPAPFDREDFGLGDSHDLGAGWVLVNGWVNTLSANGVDVTWRLRVDQSQLGPVVGLIVAGPPPPKAETTATTHPPTTTSTTPTSTSTSTTSKFRGE